MGTPLNVEGFRHKLASMNSTQDSVQTMALWVTHHRNHSKQIVEVWIQSLRDATKEGHRLTLMYLANDVIQTSRRKGGAIFKEAFSPVLEEAVALCRHESIRKSVLRIITIWEERKVLDGDFCERLQAATVSTQRPKPKVDAQFLAAFNPGDVPSAIESLAQFEGEVELKRNQLNNLNLDVASMESISKLKDRAGGKRFSEQFEDGAVKLEEFVTLLKKEVEMRKELIELLKKCEIFYEAQSSEAKIVTNAYKNFSTRVGSLKKRLEEYKKHLPGNKEELSPLPSPSVDAPSPGATPPEDPATDKVNTEDMDVSDEEGGIQRGSIMAVATLNKSKPSRPTVLSPERKANLEQLTSLTGASFLTGGLGFKSSAMDTPSPTGSNISAPSPENSPSDTEAAADEPYDPAAEPGLMDTGVAEPTKEETKPVTQDTEPANQETDLGDPDWLELEAEMDAVTSAAEQQRAKPPDPPAKLDPALLFPNPHTGMSFYGSRTASPLVPYYDEEEEATGGKESGGDEGAKDEGGGTPLRDEEGEEGGAATSNDSLKKVVEEATSNPIGFLSKIINRSKTTSSPSSSDSFMSSLSMLAKTVQAPQVDTSDSHKGATTRRHPKQAKHPFGLGQFLAKLSGAKPVTDPESDEDTSVDYLPSGFGEGELIQSQEPVEQEVNPRRNLSSGRRSSDLRGEVHGTEEKASLGSSSRKKHEVSEALGALVKPSSVPGQDGKAETPPKLPPGPPPGPPPPDARRGPGPPKSDSEGGEEEQSGPSMIMYEMASDDEDDRDPPSYAKQFDASSFLDQDNPKVSVTFTSTQSFMDTDLNTSLENSLYTSSSLYSSSSLYGGAMSTGGNIGPVSADPAVTNSAISYEPAAVASRPPPLSSLTLYDPASVGVNSMSIPGLDGPAMSYGQPPPLSYSQASYTPTPISSGGYIPGFSMDDTTTSQPLHSQSTFNSPPISSHTNIPGLGVPSMDPTQPPPAPAETSYSPTPVSGGSQIPGIGSPDMIPGQPPPSQPPPSQTDLYSPPVSGGSSIPGLGGPAMDTSQLPPSQTRFTSPPTSSEIHVPGFPRFIFDHPPPPPPVQGYNPQEVTSPGQHTQVPPAPTEMEYQPTPISNGNAPPVPPTTSDQAPPGPSPGYYSRQGSDGGLSMSPAEELSPQLPVQDNMGYYPPSSGDSGFQGQSGYQETYSPGYSQVRQFPPQPPGYQPLVRDTESALQTSEANQGFISPSADPSYQPYMGMGDSNAPNSNAPIISKMEFGSPEEGVRDGFGTTREPELKQEGRYRRSESGERGTYKGYSPPAGVEPTSPISVIRPRSPRYQHRSPRGQSGSQSTTIQVLGSGPNFGKPGEGAEDKESWAEDPSMSDQEFGGDNEDELPLPVRPPYNNNYRGTFHHPPRGHRFPHPPRPHRTPFNRPLLNRAPMFGRPRWPRGPPRMRFPPRHRQPFGFR